MDLCRLCCRIRRESRKRTRVRQTSTGTRVTIPRCRCIREVEAQRALTKLRPMGYQRAIEIGAGVSVEFVPAGHLLGSAFAVMSLLGGPTILFGGDLGRYGRPVP